MWLTGNDHVRISNVEGTVLDKFGRGSDVSGNTDHTNPWSYENAVAKRNNGSTQNNGTFSESNWTFMSTPWSDATTTCANMATDVAFGTYSTVVLSVGKNEISQFNVYPNPIAS